MHQLSCGQRRRGAPQHMQSRVVITGIGMVSPVGLDRVSTWENLQAGRSGIDRIQSFDAEGFQTTIAAEATGFEP